ncbi:TPA: hypothetical protein EYP37_01750 [Candidatus Poribacteria bacterium]|nr:hypothetical protein [Candidatus Poribacteria bacterium]
MKIPEKDKAILRKLAGKVAEIAEMPVQREKIEMWHKLNQLEPVRPMVLVHEIPWHEIEDEELQLQTTHPFVRQLEARFRRTIYQWEHIRADMVVEPVIFSPPVYHDTGFGIREISDIVRVDPRGVASRRFHPQIRDERDLEKIKTPQITYDPEGSEENYRIMEELLGDILEVRRGGIGVGFAPWDQLVTWWGVEEAFLDMVLRPDLVHAAMERLLNAHLKRLEQIENLGLLSLNNRNVRVGSGGYGYTDELPKTGFDPAHVRSIDLWGFATSQILVGVSPEMHEEFALKYEGRWLERFGLSYYGCCEPLHHKVDILRRNIPNLRKISMSPWADLEVVVQEVGGDYVISWKPNPAILASEGWDPDFVRKEIRRSLDILRGCVVEVIMKDISTVRYQPKRLWDWARIALEEAEKTAP